MNTHATGRLRIKYDIEVYGKEKEMALPFVIGVIADLTGHPPEDRPPWKYRRFREVTWKTLLGLRRSSGSGGSEDAWRGLELLVPELETGEDLKIRVLDASREELAAMFREYPGDAWDQSPLFREIYGRTYGMFGGEPYALLIADYRPGDSDEDALIARELERIARAAVAPLLCPVEGQPDGAIYSFAAEIGRAVSKEGWCGGLEKPAWADAAGLDFEAVRRLLCTGPFVHHLKGEVRDKIGSFKDKEAMGRWLNLWLAQYVAPEPGAVSLARPLIEGTVELTASTRIQGVFSTHIGIRPGYRFDDPGLEEVETYLPGLR